MIELNDRYLIGKGRSRSCYLHPDDDNKIIKVMHRKSVTQKDANDKEWQHYHFLLKHHGRLAFISKCFGFEETNIGKGLVWNCFRDHSGNISKNVVQAMKIPQRYNRTAVLEKLERFFKLIETKNIQLFDLNPKNILIRVPSTGVYEVVCADIKGRYVNHEFIPISTYIPFFSRRKLNRRSNRLMLRLKSIADTHALHQIPE